MRGGVFPAGTVVYEDWFLLGSRPILGLLLEKLVWRTLRNE